MPVVADDITRVPQELDADSVAEVAPSAQRRPRISHLAIRSPIALLGLITLLGGILRFASLSQPALWGDEAFTFSRVCGSYRQMLDVLQANGFMPLHYTLYWWLGQHFDLSPIVMRLPVAIAGTLMPPAMYFLARQLRLPATTALVVALFTACSAYMLVYSRDAKMYMPLYLACATYVGCVLWWVNGLADKAQEGASDEPRHRGDSFESLSTNVPAASGEADSTCESGLAIETRSDADSSASSHRAVTSPPLLFRYLCVIATGILACGFHALGCVVVGVSIVMVAASRAARWGAVARLIAMPFLAAGAAVASLLKLARAPWFRERSGFSGPLRRVAAGMRWPGILLFIVAAAVPLVATKLYFQHFTRWDDRVADDWNASGIQWVQGYNTGRDGPGLVVYTATAFLMSWEYPTSWWLAQIDPRALKLLTGASVFFFVAAAVGVLPWRRNRWRRTRDGGSLAGRDGGTLGLARSAARLDTRPYFALFCVLVWLMVPAYIVYCRSIQPFAPPWEPIVTAGKWVWASPWISGLVVLAALGSLWRIAPTWRDRLARCGLFLLVVAVIFGTLCVEYELMSRAWRAAQAARESWRSIWMPRYVGMIWPAFTIAVVVLLLRLPTRTLRIGVIAVLLAVNLIQFGTRVWGGSEPPTDKLAEDIVQAQPLFLRQQLLAADLVQQTMRLVDRVPTRLARVNEQLKKLPLVAPDTRVYVQTGSPDPAPGGGVIGSFAARYYLTWRSGAHAEPPQFRQWRSSIDRTWTFPIGLSPRPIGDEMRKSPQYNRLITWDRINPGQRDVNYDDPVIKALGPGWKRVSERVYPARDHWNWRHLYDLRRREYVRTAPATQPARS